MSPRHSASLGEMYEARDDWRKPKPVELLYDAADFCKKARKSQKSASKGRYGRASIPLSVAAVEAFSNDTLLSIFELLVDSWPSGCIGLPPWRYFRRVSSRPIESLLRRHGSLGRKIRYILGHLRRLSEQPLEDLSKIENQLKRAVQARNRIVHMTYLVKPSTYSVFLNPRQVVPLAESALKAAEVYISEVAYTLEEVKLPVLTPWETSFRPDWWPEGEWE